MSKKKVLFITPSLCQGGLEHSLITMLNILDKSKYDITLFTYREDLSLLGLVPEEVKVVNDTEKPHYYRRPKAVFYKAIGTISNKLSLKNSYNKTTEKLNKYIRQQRVNRPARVIFKNQQFDIVISYAIGICTEMALSFKAKKYYTFFHSSLDLHHEMLEKLFPFFDGIVAVNDGVKEMLFQNYPHVRDKIRVLKNYVNAQNIIDKATEKVNIKSSGTILCTCGRLSAEKGFDLAVESARVLKKIGIDFTWYFVGDGGERVRIEDLINQYSLNDNIVITGYINNPFSYMKACDIYIQPSYEEAQPLAVLEAMVLGKAIVSTKTVGGKYILENGNKGILTEISGESLAEGIMSLIENPELRHSFENQYTLEDNMKEKQIYIDKWNELLS